MTIKCTKVTTRPGTDVPWHFDKSLGIATLELQKYINETYRKTGKLISDSNFVSKDGLKLTYTALWDSMESYNEYDVDPAFDEFRAKRNAYYASSGCIVGNVKLTEVQT